MPLKLPSPPPSRNFISLFGQSKLGGRAETEQWDKAMAWAWARAKPGAREKAWSGALAYSKRVDVQGPERARVRAKGRLGWHRAGAGGRCREQSKGR